ncbi:acetate kinase [Psychromonas aquatilis]|uniref:Acetate kinase n=1 Tax=Psychromonas aquatilis TaxID=2005072 RepID=A0ABU9GKZ7_9GAMM
MSNKLVLVLNGGSSSLKFAVINVKTGEAMISGLAECFNLPEARITWKHNGTKNTASLPENGARSQAMVFIVNNILNKIEGIEEQLIAVGHRIVHGGEHFSKSMVIDDTVFKGIEDCIPLAPLHNPAHISGIKAARVAFPKLKQVAVFDTAFHQTMPQKAYLYALPYELYQDSHIRRYGMHGTSHQFIMKQAADALDIPVDKINIISAHLGNGASVAAIKNGQCVDTSMGMTPLAGLVMGTRCGDLDPSIIEFLVEQKGYSLEEAMNLLQKESGLKGISGVSSDWRQIEEAVNNGVERAILAVDMFCYRLAKYIASYAVPLGRIDALVFTGGIGENAVEMRTKVLENLAIFGYKIDQEKNDAAKFGESGIITADQSPIAIVIPTNEEWVIAQDAAELVSQ